MKKVLFPLVLVLFSCSKVESQKSTQVFAKVKVANSLIESVKGVYDTLYLQVDCVPIFAQSGTTESIIIIPKQSYTPCYDADFGYNTWSQSESKDVTFRIVARGIVLRSGVIRFTKDEHSNVID